MRNGNGKARLLPTDQGFPVALYARVSTTQQDPEVQLHELRALASARGWTITQEYVDAGISGASTNRPELARLLADAHKGCFAGILVWRLDRLGRSLRHLVPSSRISWRGGSTSSLQRNPTWTPPPQRAACSATFSHQWPNTKMLRSRRKYTGPPYGRPRKAGDSRRCQP